MPEAVRDDALPLPAIVVDLEGVGAVQEQVRPGLNLGEEIEVRVEEARSGAACNPTVNLYSSLHVRRGGRIVDVWPIAGRY